MGFFQSNNNKKKFANVILNILVEVAEKQVRSENIKEYIAKFGNIPESVP
jgi:hypothetical protein